MTDPVRPGSSTADSAIAKGGSAAGAGAVALASALRGRQARRTGGAGRLAADADSLVLTLAGCALGLWAANEAAQQRAGRPPTMNPGTRKFAVVTVVAALILGVAALLASVGPDGLAVAGLALAALAGAPLVFGVRPLAATGIMGWWPFTGDSAGYGVLLGMILLGGGIGLALRPGAPARDRSRGGL